MAQSNPVNQEENTGDEGVIPTFRHRFGAEQSIIVEFEELNLKLKRQFAGLAHPECRIAESLDEHDEAGGWVIADVPDQERTACFEVVESVVAAHGLLRFQARSSAAEPVVIVRLRTITLFTFLMGTPHQNHIPPHGLASNPVSQIRAQ